MKRTSLFIILFLLLVTSAWAKNLYVSPTGSDSVTYANNDISHPWATWSKAVLNALSGDIVYFRGGTYTISSTIDMRYGHNGSSGSPITYKNYPGEKVITNITSATGFYWDALYNQIEADTNGNIEFNGVSWVFWVGNNGDGSGFSIKRCKLTASSYSDNQGTICLQAERSSSSVIQYNDISSVSASTGSGIIYLGGRNTGTRILNNTIHGCGGALYIKHRNYDTDTANAEIAYNYIYSCSYAIHGVPNHINIHDNIFTSTFSTGDCGGSVGGICPGDNNLFNHNTIKATLEFQAPSEGATNNSTITNNIINSRSGVGTANTFDYNMYVNGTAIGAHDLANTSPTYVGGASPSTIAGFALTEASNGYHACADGSDMGANVTLVGPTASESTPTAPTSAIKLYLTNTSSQGAAQPNPNASLGGYRSTTLLSATSMKNLFDDVSVAESVVGDTEYRMIDVYNAGSVDMKKVQIFMKTPTSSPSTELAFGYSATAQPHADSWNGEALATESAAPASPAFSFANRTRGSPLSLGTIPAGQSVRVGIRRTVNALSSWTTSDLGVIGTRWLGE